MWPFKKRTKRVVPTNAGNAPSIEQLSYGVAYFLLPHYAFKALGKAVEMWTKTPSTTGPFYYLMACQMQKAEPDTKVASGFRSRHGELPGIGHYYLLEYPSPTPIELSNRDPMEVVERGESFVLAPYFSVIIQPAGNEEAKYYILGQAPIGGGTTLRCITPDGTNANLGPGPSPTVENFLEAVGQRCSLQRA